MSRGEIDPNIPFSEYLVLDRYGSSDLRTMRAGPPALVKWRRENREDGEAMKLGTACHCAVLTPNLFHTLYALKPEGMTFASKEGKEWRDARKGQEILTFAERETVEAVVAAFRGKRAASEALARAVYVEASVLWECGKSGLRSKARPDWFDGEAVYDLKVSRHAASALSLAYRAYCEGWMHQLAHNRAALNSAGARIDRGRLVVVSPKAPQGIHVQLLEVKMDALDLLELENEATRMRIAACDRNGVWPGTGEDWQLVEPPAGALMETIGILEETEATNG